MRRNLAFELLIILIALSPFAYLLLNWDIYVSIPKNKGIYWYILAVVFFYALPLLMQYLDSKKPNADFLLRSDKRIRIIWSSYLAALGFILFYYTLHHFENDQSDTPPARFLGVALSLFLFASGNFQSNLHPTSAFAGNGWFAKEVEERNYRKLQRFTARLFFWAGILGTIFFLYFTENILVSWGLVFIGLIIFYGIIIRLIRNIVAK